MTREENMELAKQLAAALADLNAVRTDMERYPSRYGPFPSLLERAAVGIEGVRVALRMA